MIQQIGFKNFRRFEEFPMMNLAKINIFVGRNNTGKSTVLKALQLLKSNLKSLSKISNKSNVFASMHPMFVFGLDENDELHIDNFERALYKKAKRKEIALSATIDDCFFSVILNGEGIQKNGNNVAVPYSAIELESRNLRMFFDFQSRDLKIEFFEINKEKLDSKLSEKEELEKDKIKLESIVKNTTENLNKISSEGSPTELKQAVSEAQDAKSSWAKVIAKLSILNKEIKNLEDNLEFCFDIKNLPDYSDTISVNIIDQLFYNLQSYADDEEFKDPNYGMDRRTTEYKELCNIKEKLSEVMDVLQRERLRFLRALSGFDIEYIHAHAASQRVIYLKKDRNDVLSRALSEFCKSRIGIGEPEWQFVKKWMGYQYFGIGEDFHIEHIQSAGYTFSIIDDNEELNLADKGTGSIQLMTLLLSLAVIMRKVRTENYYPIILIEEPEQNLHPMLQSLLADLFADFCHEVNSHLESVIVNGNKECQLIVETHSEYLIRRTQLIVTEIAKDGNYNIDELAEVNHFKVFYFPSDKYAYPYDMIYQQNGLFLRKFDTGFFDEAGKLHMQILKNSNKS